MITEFLIENFRSHRRTNVALGRWTILYGANGSGKSSVLDALNNVSSFIGGTRADEVFQRGAFFLGAQMLDPALGSVAFTVRYRAGGAFPGMFPEDLEYHVEFAQNGTGTVARSERLSVDGGLVLKGGGQVETALDLSTDGEAAQDVRSAHRHARRYRLEPQALRKPTETHNFIDRTGLGLPSSLKQLSVEDPNTYRNLLDDFLSIHPDIADIRTMGLGAGDIAVEFDSRGSKNISGAYLSDGQALTLGLLFLAHAPRAPQLLLLDEPELALSPVAIQNLLSCLENRLARDRQVIVTTHSPFVIRWGIDNSVQVRQIRPDIGSRSWREALDQQGVTIDSPVRLVDCCALLETYLTG